MSRRMLRNALGAVCAARVVCAVGAQDAQECFGTSPWLRMPVAQLAVGYAPGERLYQKGTPWCDLPGTSHVERSY